jgi:integrase
MPKNTYKPPKYCKLKVGKSQYAVVYQHGKTIYLGAYGSPESKAAYSKFIAKHKPGQDTQMLQGEPDVTVQELAIAFLDYALEILKKDNYVHHRIAACELLGLFGDDTLADEFKIKDLKLYQKELIKTGRFCRNSINDYVRRIKQMFTWGAEEEMLTFNTAFALKAVKALKEGHPGTFDHPEREDVPDEVIKRTLPFMPPIIAAMVILQRLTGMRPSEIFNMRVRDIDMHTDPELWLYRLPSHKTQKKIKRKKVIPLGKPEQKLLAPYLKGKKPEQAVFSPAEAMAERKAERRANRKTKLTPSQAARDASRAKKPRTYNEFYNECSYKRAVDFAIAKGNKVLPEGEKIPHWTPYQLRHTAATAMEDEAGLDEAQALLDHSSAQTTKRYAHARLKKLKKLARNRRNPFE